jgi:hypothetical protein
MAEIDKLITRLDKLVTAMEKGSSGSRKPGERQPRDAGPAGGFSDVREDAKKSAVVAAEEVKNLENKKSALGKLAPEQERQLRLLKEELEIKERMGKARSWKQYEEERIALQELNEAREDAADALHKLNNEVEAGEEKAKALTSDIMKVDGAFLSLSKRIPLSRAQIKGFGKGMKDLFTSGNLAVGFASEMFNASLAIADAGAEFVKTTGAADAHMRVITDVRNEYRHLGVDAAAASAAGSALYSNFQDFTTLSETQKTTLAGQAAVLGTLGISAQSTGLIFDQATKSLGFNAGELVDLTEHLHSTAQSLGKTTQQVFQDFASASKKLAFYGTNVIDVFDKLQKQSKATGISVDDLISISGTAFDTFDGAGQKVGRLNAILGGPYLNSIDMLNASEADRIEMLKDSMDMSGQMFSQLNKYEQLAMADALGVDVDQARRMFGELSAAEEMQIKQQEEIAETSARAMKQADKLTNAFKSLFVASKPLADGIAAVVSGLARFFSTDFAKYAVGLIAIASGFWSIFAAVKKVKKVLDFSDVLGGEGGDGLISRLTGGGKGGSPEEASGGFISWVERLMEAIKGSAKELLAFGAAMLMMGAGIGAAAFGLSYLVEAFQGLTAAQMVGAIVGMIVVFAGFAVAIVLLGKASLTSVGPMMALGVALLLMGGGIAIAAYGMSLLVASFAQLEGDQIWAAAQAIMVFSVAMVALVAVAAFASAAYPALLAVAAILAAIGVAAVLMGLGISIAAKGLTVLVAQLVQIPADQVSATAGAVIALGYSLMTLGAGVAVAAVGLGVLGLALTYTATPLLLGSFALGTFGAALMIVGIGMTLVSAGAISLASSVTAFSRVLPELREFTSALKDIGGASWGIIKTAAAMAALTASLGRFAIGLALLQLKKLEALAEFNKSATLTVKSVQKPGVPTEAIKATETRMESVTSPGGTNNNITNNNTGMGQQPSNINVIVKIGERQLRDIFIDVLRDPTVSSEISGFGGR